jgi:hypothetical protein
VAATIYAGPAKVWINSVAMQSEGENGPVHIAYNEDTAEIAAAMYGRISEQERDAVVDVTVKPFDNWGLLATLFPPYTGVKVGATAAALLIGKRPHTEPTGNPTKVWTPDGRLYQLVRTAVIGHPSLHLGIGKGLYGDVRIVGLPDLGVAMGGSGYLFTGNAITESAASDPGGAMTMADFVREAWTGVWGTVAGFGGGGGDVALQAEEEWTIETTIKYSSLKVQGRTLAMKLDSCAFMIRTKPFGPTHTQIIAAVGAHTQGSRLGSADLTLTGQLSAKTITLKNAEVRGAGFDFGGTTLGTGEIGFVNTMTFTAGAPQSLIEFSA